MEMTLIGEKYLLVVVGGYDSKIHCYTCLRNNDQQQPIDKYFEYKLSLTGHLNSLKSFAFTYPKFEMDDEQ
jgi:hypothetical protein